MKKIIFTFCLFAVSIVSKGQLTLYNEDFEAPGVGSWANSSVIPSTGAGFIDNTALFVSGSHSALGTITNVNDTNILETTGFFDPNSFSFFTMTFKHIAKVDFFDRCIIECSTDFGTTWTKLDNTNSTYNGSSLTWPSTQSFSAASYVDWWPSVADSTPNNLWWITESFDVSIFCAFQSDVRFRFKMFDNNGNGGTLNYGWCIDDINITGAYCELIPPVMTQTGNLSGAVYSTGPFNVTYNSVDQSGISYGYVVYTITNGTGSVTDSVLMTNPGGNTWSGQIPIISPGDSITAGDTVCYYAYTVDASGCLNYAYVPSNGGCTSFFAATAAGFPYCNSFDDLNDTTWTAVTLGGSNWEHGVPNVSPINTTYSGPGCWDVDLNNVYQSNTEAYLYSPIFQWANNPNVKMSFYQNRDVEAGWDGTTVQFQVDGAGPWIMVGILNDPQGTNWYNTDQINSSQDSGFWEGSSNGWVYSDLDLYQLNNITGAIQFRFIFTSDPSVENNTFAIDNFCLKLPQLFDAGVYTITEPINEIAAGSNSPVTLTVKNFGITPLSSGDFDIVYDYGAGPVTTSYTGPTLGPGAVSAPITLPSTFVVPTGSFSFCAWTSFTSDGDHTNDTLCKTSLGIPTFTPPYCDNFDTGTVFWNGLSSLLGNTSWQLGTPTLAPINSAKSAPNAWVTNLTSNYGNQVDVELKSPFFDFSQASTNNSTISFWLNRSITSNADGLVLEYTTNGTNWLTLGTGALGTNWYNNTTVGPNFIGPGWDGNSGGWVRCDYPVAFLNGTPSVRFRFHFESGFNNPGRGAGIDNFCIKPPVPNDAGVKRIISPFGQVNAGILLVPTVVLRNYGNNTLNSIDVSYNVNSVLTGSGIFTGTLNPGDSVTFNSWPGFTVPTCAFNFSAYTQLVADGDLSNDTNSTDVVGVPVYPIPAFGSVCDNFDSASCWTSVPSPQGASRWELGTPAFGTTNSANSAPNSWDINLNTPYDNNGEAYLYTSKFDFSGAVNPTVSFYHNWNTDDGWDGVRMEYDTTGTGNWVILGTAGFDPDAVNWYTDPAFITDNLPGWTGTSTGVFGSSIWLKSSHNLNFLSGKPDVQFRYWFVSNTFTTGDGYSIDDFCVTTPPPHDIGVVKIIRPGPLEGAGNTLAPRVVIKNYGSSIETNSDVVYSVNAGAPLSFAWTGNLLPNSTDTVSLPTFLVPAQSFSFCAWTELIGDGDLSNDTLCGSSFGVPVVVPTYADNFDTGAVGFVNVPGTVGAATNWELGTPNVGQTNSAHSAPNCWDVNLNITYANNDSCFLYTPIFNLSGKQAPVLRFWHNRNLDNFNGDGVQLEYTINGGTNWNVLGSAGLSVPQALNWYNSANIFSNGGEPGWNGTSGGWKFTYLALNTTIFDGSPGLQVQFRFVFTSDGFTQVDGFSVDEFELFIPTALSVAPIAVIPVNKLLTPGPQVITAKIRNKGTTAVTTANVTLKIDNTIIVTDSVTFNPALIGASYTTLGGLNLHTFSLPWNASPGAHTICVYTDSPNSLKDQDSTDDTLCVDFTVFDSVTVSGGNPYCTDFEAGPQWVTLNSLTYTAPNNPGPISWELGLPSKACLNSTHSGVRAWSTNLAVNYPNRDTSALFTPVFNVDNTKCYKFSFWQKYDTEQFQDGGNIESSTDSGNTWTVVGWGGEPNWYNSQFVTGLGGVPPKSGFSGTDCNWTQATHQWLPQTNATTVIFRFRFGSDFSFNKEGWAIDDVCFEELATPCVLTVGDPANIVGLNLGQNYPNPTNSLTSFDFNLPESGKVEIELTDLMGHVILTPVSGNMPSGINTVTIDTKPLSPGIYFYSLKFNDSKLVKKMVIAK